MATVAAIFVVITVVVMVLVSPAKAMYLSWSEELMHSSSAIILFLPVYMFLSLILTLIPLLLCFSYIFLLSVSNNTTCMYVT